MAPRQPVPAGPRAVLSIVVVLLYLIVGGLINYLVFIISIGGDGSIQAASWYLAAVYVVFGGGALLVWLIAVGRSKHPPNRRGYGLSALLALIGAVINILQIFG